MSCTPTTRAETNCLAISRCSLSAWTTQISSSKANRLHTIPKRVSGSNSIVVGRLSGEDWAMRVLPTKRDDWGKQSEEDCKTTRVMMRSSMTKATSLTRGTRVKNPMMKAAILRTKVKAKAMILRASLTNKEMRTSNQERMASFAKTKVRSMPGILIRF